MKSSIKKRIYWSFAVLTALFLVNGIITVYILNKHGKSSTYVSSVVDPSVHRLEEFHMMLLESKMYATNWVYLRYNEADKEQLLRIHNKVYAKLKGELLTLSAGWSKRENRPKIEMAFNRFEKVLAAEKKIMHSLKKFQDYDDPVLKLEAEKLIEEEVIPGTAFLTATVAQIIRDGKHIREDQEAAMRQASQRLRTFILALVLLIGCIGFILSRYLTRIIVQPIKQIGKIVNDLGRGITNRITNTYREVEISQMVSEVNLLSDKLSYTARFAQQVGERKFDVPFQPLSQEDSLGKALVLMRDNLKSIDESLNEAQHIAKLGSWEWYIRTDKTFWSDELYNIFEKCPGSFSPSYMAFIKCIHPEDRVRIVNLINDCSANKKPYAAECRIETKSGDTKTIFIQSSVLLDEQGSGVKLYGIVQDITERKKAETELENKNYELQQKNRELEQFAYISSHDLQEPLRTISGFVGRLQLDYKGRLDERADKYIYYIAQATDRMKTLINDLLEYSRIGRKKEVSQIDCNEIVSNVLDDLDWAIEESGATIKVEKLPLINGYSTEIKQLFQNLVINAIKFRKEDVAPQIRIASLQKQNGWQFSVTDNGIGIDELHSERIFVIFQRLHSRSQYEGSGIGLSHCKKIVELHGGKIWVKSQPGKGSTFHFTILENNN